MKQVIENNSSESITVITDKDRLSITQRFKGWLPNEFLKTKVMILSRNEARRLLPILNQWLNNNADGIAIKTIDKL